MPVLEIDCGTGLFQKIFEHQGITDYLGIDAAPGVLELMPDELKKIIRITDDFQYLLSLDDIKIFDRVVLIGFFENLIRMRG